MTLAKTGLLGMIGRGERGPGATSRPARHKAASLIGIGGGAHIVSKAIRKSRVLAFADLGMEGDERVRGSGYMPVTVAVEANGNSVHQSGPAEWANRIRELKIPVSVASTCCGSTMP